MKKQIELSDISRYRGELMGLAMIFVMLFHVWMPKSYFFYGLNRCGNVGVDMFLFLSGIGLWYSWCKNTSVKNFFWRRYIRIYPAWVLMASLFYIPNYLNVPGGGYSPDLLNLVLNILINWSFWRIDDLTFWFIPAIMMMYTFAPAYMNLIRRNPAYRWLPVAAMVLAVMVQYYPPIHQSVGHVEIFFSRIPIFLIGINFGEYVKEQKKFDGSSIWLFLILFVMSLAMCIEFEESWRGRFPLFLERMVYIPLTISGIVLLSLLLRHTPSFICRGLAFVGSVSLELYLIHIQFVLKYVKVYKLGYCLTALTMIAISLVLAWILHRGVGLLTKKLPKNIG
ncbi:MAG: acyltransferase [Prevotellaceae bacterium]|nr:acyltransferase [Prevotellaceae bacterium]